MGIVFDSPMSILSTSAFKLAKSDFAGNLEVISPVAFFKSAFVALLYKSTLTLMSLLNVSYVLGKYWLIFI